MSAVVINFADHRARSLVVELLTAQARIDETARDMLNGRTSGDEKLTDLLEHTERLLTSLSEIAPTVTGGELRKAIEATCRSYREWERARLGSPEEREAASTYLRNVDWLAFVSKARRA